MLAFITTEFQKLKRYSIILVGMLGVACSPIISIVMQKIMTDEAKNVLNYTFPDLLNSTIWNNMTMFFPMIIALIGGYMINRELNGKPTEYPENTLVPYPVILAASKGDPDAMKIVLQHFSGYIARLSMRKLYDERGNVYFGVDEEIRERLQTKLMRAILTFKAE